MKKLNPIFASFFSMLIFLTAGLIYAGIMDNIMHGGYGFILSVYTFYLLPFVGLFFLGIWSFFKRGWVKENKTSTAIFGSGLFVWAVLTVVHIITL